MDRGGGKQWFLQELRTLASRGEEKTGQGENRAALCPFTPAAGKPGAHSPTCCLRPRRRRAPQAARSAGGAGPGRRPAVPAVPLGMPARPAHASGVLAVNPEVGRAARWAHVGGGGLVGAMCARAGAGLSGLPALWDSGDEDMWEDEEEETAQEPRSRCLFCERSVAGREGHPFGAPTGSGQCLRRWGRVVLSRKVPCAQPVTLACCTSHTAHLHINGRVYTCPGKYPRARCTVQVNINGHVYTFPPRCSCYCAVL